MHEAKSLTLALDGFRHGTVGPGSVLIIPDGYMIVEKTLGLSSLGLKRNLFPNSEDELSKLKVFLNAQATPVRGGNTAVDIAQSIVKKRARA